MQINISCNGGGSIEFDYENWEITNINYNGKINISCNVDFDLKELNITYTVNGSTVTNVPAKSAFTQVTSASCDNGVEASWDSTNWQLNIGENNNLKTNCTVAFIEKYFEVGDYITLIPSKASYSIPASSTGYDTVQTIKPNELTLWRVIDFELTRLWK